MAKNSAIKSVSSVVDRVALELARAYDSRETILITCRLAHEGMEGLTTGTEANDRRKALATATSRALSELLYPNDPKAQERARTIAANRPGGASVTDSAIRQRANAYGHVLAAGLTPDITNVTAAFRLHSITGKGHAQYVADVTERVLSDGADFAAEADKASDALTAARPGKGGRKPDPDAKADMTPDAVVAALTWASAHVGAFKGDVRETFVALLADLSAQTAE